MPGSFLTSELQSVLALQGIGPEVLVAAFEVDAPTRGALASMAEELRLVELASLEEAAKMAKGSAHLVLVTPAGRVKELLQAIGPEAANTVAVIGVGGTGEDGVPSAASLRSIGAMAVAPSPEAEVLRPLLQRGLEFRALRALELAHRCEARRLRRREMDLLGYPPETMTDDLNTFQPPPLPVGPISTFNLEAVSEAFERAYIDRVQLLCESAREAAKHLDVSAATLARRLRRDGGTDED